MAVPRTGTTLGATRWEGASDVSLVSATPGAPAQNSQGGSTEFRSEASATSDIPEVKTAVNTMTHTKVPTVRKNKAKSGAFARERTLETMRFPTTAICTIHSGPLATCSLTEGS
eukprot:scaffold706_cov418-Prasinococcus_capsulatus_cf.AAC.58